MKDKLMALVIIALIIEVLAIVIISFLAMLGAMNLTDGCMYRYPTSGSTASADATVANFTVKANGNYTTATTTDEGSTVQIPTPGPQIYSDGTTGYTYGQWLKTNIGVQKGQAITLGISGNVSLCRAYLPINNLESNSNVAVYATPSNNKIVPGKLIPIPRLEESTPPIQLLFDASNSGGWRNLTKLGFQDEVQVTIGDNPIEMTQGTVTLNNLKAMSFQSLFSGVNGLLTANCSDGSRAYSPNGGICNRYTPYSIPNQEYITSCTGSIIQQKQYWTCGGGSSGYSLRTKCSSAHPGRYCLSVSTGGCCIVSAGTCRDGCPNVNCHETDPTADYWEEAKTVMPQPYTSAGTYTWAVTSTDVPLLFPYGSSGFLASTGTTSIEGADGKTYASSNICASQNSGFALTTTPTLGTWPGDANGSYLSRQFFWLASNAAIGLYERTNDGSISTDLGSDHKGVKIIKGQSVANVIKKVGGNGVPQAEAGYLQYRFMTIGDSPAGTGTPTFNYNSGGYVISLKQTACRAIDGASIPLTTDPNAPLPANTNPYKLPGDIGDLRYLILDSDIDPNNPANASYLSQSAALPSGTSTFTPSITSSNPQTLWLKIANHPANYADSFGQYNVNLYSVVSVGQFSSLVLDKVLKNFKTIIVTAGTRVFERMTCMQCDTNNPGASCAPVGDKSDCSNFLMYIRAMLTLYVMIFGMMFLLGMVKISNQDFVIRVVKIVIVAGLISGDTLRFFNDYVFNFVTQFSDEMIANLSGYAANITTVDTDVSNPFLFLDALMSRIFFSKTFFTQVLALLSLGISGAFYFIIVFIALVVLIITVFRAVSIYIMAFMAVALLLGLAPLFLTFLLFEKTYYLFENWVRFLFRYMMEPVILMAGITILTQLFTVYLDYVLNYSVCWKCGLVFKIPFAGIPGLNMFQDLPLFCINWFTPWGLDNSGASGMMGMNLQNMVALVMIAYAMYGYTEISGSIVGRLTNSMTAPSMTSAGNAMSGAVGQKILKQFGMDSKTREDRERKYNNDAARSRHEVNKLLDDQKKWKTSDKPLSAQAPKAGNDLQNNKNTGEATAGSLDPNATKSNASSNFKQPFASPSEDTPFASEGGVKEKDLNPVSDAENKDNKIPEKQGRGDIKPEIKVESESARSKTEARGSNKTPKESALNTEFKKKGSDKQ